MQPVATMQGGRCATSPRLKFFWCGRVSTELFKPNGMKEIWAKPSVMADHRMAEEIYNLSEVVYFVGGGRVFYRTIHAAGMKEKENIES